MPAAFSIDSRLAAGAPAAGQRAAGGVVFDIVAGTGAILALEAEWRVLEAEGPDTALFQSFDWCRNHLDATAESARWRPVALLARRAGRPVALLPAAVIAKHGLHALTGMCEPFQQYSELLLARGESPAAHSSMLLAAIKSLRVDYLHFGQVRAGGALAEVLGAFGAAQVDCDAAPYVELSAFPHHDAYLATLNAKTRKNLRNAVNRLQRQAELAHVVTREGPQFVAAIGRTYEGRAAWLKRLGLTSRAFRDADFSDFVRRFAEGRAKGIDTVAMSLSHGGNPVSDQWGFLYKGRYYAFMATWNASYEAVSPGRIHLGEVIGAAFSQGWRVADFMIPAVPYKLTWATGSAPVGDYVLPLSLRGYVQVEGWLRRLRPFAKRLVAGFSPALRSRLLKWLLPWFE
jgi:CelD/BcsL family acetyltransferase involved in cellulose biosynthesis